MLAWKGGPNISGVLNQLSMTMPPNILQQAECNVLLDEFQTVTETTNASRLLSSDKAPGSDIIPTQINKAGGQPTAALFHCMWRKEAIPQEFKDAIIMYPYIRKRNAQVCDSHRVISLLYCLLPGRYWQNPTESPGWTSWSGWNSTRKSVWIQEGQKNNMPMVRQFHDGMLARLRKDREYSKLLIHSSS